VVAFLQVFLCISLLSHACWSRDSSVGMVGWQYTIFLLSTASRSVLGPTQPSIQWKPGVKRLDREADHTPPSSAGALCLTKHRDNFALPTHGKWKYTQNVDHTHIIIALVNRTK
jgi:hypothetical protein